MKRIAFKEMPLQTNRFARLPHIVHWVVFGLFLAGWGAGWLRFCLANAKWADAPWPDGVLLVLATATTLASMVRRLPGQNVMLAAIVIAVMGGAIHTLGGLTAMPFGPFVFTDRVGRALFEPLPWSIPLLWLVVILNARGVARLVLRPWRQARNYGFWLLGVGVLLVVLFDFSLEPFATQVMHYWTWKATKLPFDWYSTPYVNFLGWALSALLILILVTPALLNKSPTKRPTEHHSLVAWLALLGVLATAAVRHQFWTAAIFTGVHGLLVGGFCLVQPANSRGN
jgi:uncharacterized membrane protein